MSQNRGLSARPFHPLIIGLFPMVSFYATNIGSTPPSQLWRPAIAIMICVALLWLILKLLLKSTWRSALVTSILTLLFFSYQHSENYISRYWSDLSYGRPATRLTFFAVFLVTFLAIGLLASRIKKGEAAANGFLNVVALVLLLTSSVSAYAAYSGTIEGEQEIASRSGHSGSGQAISGAKKPDVFYLLVDGYGRQDTLKEYMGLDNAPFISELEKRGFYIADKSHSNYAQTELSLPASLNMQYVDEILKTMPPNFPRTRQALQSFVDYNTVSDEFRKEGYTYIYVSTGFPFFTGAGADTRTLGEVPGLTLFESSLIDLTPLTLVKTRFLSPADQKRNLVRSAFWTLKSLGHPGVKPKFVFAHILLPHPPFVFQADGTARSPKVDSLFDGSMYIRAGGTSNDYVDGYKNQLLYANSLLLETIDSIQRSEEPAPIIVIQGDHGSRLHHDFGSLKDTDLRESLAILNAYYVPQNVRNELYPSITPVNSFRVILGGLFSRPFPVLPDRMFYSTWDTPDDFTDVTKQVQMADSVAIRRASR